VFDRRKLNKEEAMRRGIATTAALLATILSLHTAHAADTKLIEAAKAEGQVTWYSSNVIDQLVRPAGEAFEKKYGIKANYVRSDSNEVVRRVIEELKAGRVGADVIDGSTIAQLKTEKALQKYTLDSAALMPDNFHDAEGFWTAANLYVLSPGFNTNLVPKGTEPKTWEDLLNPKWKGKMAWNTSPATSASPGFVGVVLAELGQDKGTDFLRRLAKQDITPLKVAARVVLDQVIAGEYAIALQIYNNHPLISAKLGAPVYWIPMQPAMAFFGVLCMPKDAPHPNAGKLLIDFLVSEEGQTIFRNADYIPVNPNVAPQDPALRPDGKSYRATYFTPEAISEGLPKWTDVSKALFR
jgi:ABC-type Fe3+ transport system substrate-binding protein